MAAWGFLTGWACGTFVGANLLLLHHCSKMVSLGVSLKCVADAALVDMRESIRTPCCSLAAGLHTLQVSDPRASYGEADTSTHQ